MTAPVAAILVVEDEHGLRETMQWTLEDEGWHVAAAADGGEAVEYIEHTRPALIVLDMGLPVISGDGVAVAVRSRYGPEVPILVVTADGRAEQKAHQVGAYGFLAKPFDLDDFVRTVQRGLNPA